MKQDFSIKSICYLLDYLQNISTYGFYYFEDNYS